MSQYSYVGEIAIMPFDWAPRGWFKCDGQLLPINQNQALFSLLGTTYGGNGQTTFALPDFRGKTPINYGNSNTGHNYNWGQTGGTASHTLIAPEMPLHTHTVANDGVIKANTGALANQTNPVGNYFATNPAETKRFSASPDTIMGSTNVISIPIAGGNQSHQNMQPYLVLNFVIAYQGLFPSRN